MSDYEIFTSRTALNAIWLWVKEVGLAAARMEALELGGDLNSLAVKRRALEMHHRLPLAEKRAWRRRAWEEEKAKDNANQK